MPANYMAGFQSKVNINNVAYTVMSWNARGTHPDLDVTSTEGVPGNPLTSQQNVPGFDACIAGTGRMEATLRNACFDTLANPFDPPQNIADGTYITLQIFPAGRGVALFWLSSSFYVRNADMTSDVHGVQPVSFEGRSDGVYFLPTS